MNVVGSPQLVQETGYIASRWPFTTGLCLSLDGYIILPARSSIQMGHLRYSHADQEASARQTSKNPIQHASVHIHLVLDAVP